MPDKDTPGSGDPGGTPQPTEKDVMALKGKLEKAEERLEAANEAAKTKVDKAELETVRSESEQVRQQLLQAEAKVTGLEEKLQSADTVSTELAGVKPKLETAEAAVKDLTTKVLDYRRAVIVATYSIPADSIKEKTIEQLDNYEEALKAVAAAKTAGNFAIGGGGGGAAPETSMERAKRILVDADSKRSGSKE